jgi:hypothetical protein
MQTGICSARVGVVVLSRQKESAQCRASRPSTCLKCPVREVEMRRGDAACVAVALTAGADVDSAHEDRRRAFVPAPRVRVRHFALEWRRARLGVTRKGAVAGVLPVCSKEIRY